MRCWKVGGSVSYQFRTIGSSYSLGTPIQNSLQKLLPWDSNTIMDGIYENMCTGDRTGDFLNRYLSGRTTLYNTCLVDKFPSLLLKMGLFSPFHDSYIARSSWSQQVGLSEGPKPTNADYEKWVFDIVERRSSNDRIATAGLDIESHSVKIDESNGVDGVDGLTDEGHLAGGVTRRKRLAQDPT